MSTSGNRSLVISVATSPSVGVPLALFSFCKCHFRLLQVAGYK